MRLVRWEAAGLFDEMLCRCYAVLCYVVFMFVLSSLRKRLDVPESRNRLGCGGYSMEYRQTFQPHVAPTRILTQERAVLLVLCMV